MDPIAQREETSRQSDWRSPDPQEVPAISADTKKLKIGHIRRLSPVFPLPAPAVRRKSLTDAAASRSVKASRTIREISPFEDEEAALSIRQKASDEADIIEFGVGHPTNVTIGVAFVVDVLIYRQDDRSVAEERAATLRPENDGFGFAGATKVGRGTKLTVMLELPWPTEPKIQSVYWSGSITNVSFRVAPTNLAQASVYGICNILIDGLTIGHVIFKLVVEPKKSPDGRKLTWARTVKTAFASYTSKDRRRVLARVQGIEKVGVKVFLDTHGLRSNEQYKKRIFEAIDASDVLYLFWSRHALRRQILDWVTPTRLDDHDRLRLPPIPPPQSSGTDKERWGTAATAKHAGHQASHPRPLRTASTQAMSAL